MPRFEPLEGEIILTDRTVEQMDNLIRRVTEADRLLSGVQGKLAALNTGMGAQVVNFDQFERLGKALDAIDVNKIDTLRQSLGQLAAPAAGLDAAPVENLARLLDQAAESARRHASAAAGAAAAQKALNDELARAQSASAGTIAPRRLLLNEADSPYSLAGGSAAPAKAPDPVGIAQAASAVGSLANAQQQQAASAQNAADAQKSLNQAIQQTQQLAAMGQRVMENETQDQFYARATAAVGQAPAAILGTPRAGPVDWRSPDPAATPNTAAAAAAAAQQAAQATVPSVTQAATQAASTAAAQAATQAVAQNATPAVAQAATNAATQAATAAAAPAVAQAAATAATQAATQAATPSVAQAATSAATQAAAPAAAAAATPAVAAAAASSAPPASAAPPPSAPGAPSSLASVGQPGGSTGNSTTDLLMALLKGMSVGTLELSKRNDFVQGNPLVNAGFSTMQAGQTLGSFAPMLGGGAGGVAALGGIVSGAGTAVAAVGALVGVFNQFNDALADSERRQIAIDKLAAKFGDVREVVDQTQAAIKNVASEGEIEGVMGSISSGSVLTDMDSFVQISEIAQRKAYQLGTSWKEAMGTISQAVQTGNGDALKQLGLVENPTRTLLEYAESVGKLVPQLSEWEIQQALLNATLATGGELLATPMSESERLIAAYDTLESSVSDATAAFSNWVISLVSPDAQSAVGWWADQMNGIAQTFDKVAQGQQQAANENRARALAEESGQGDAYSLLMNQRSSAQGALTGELMSRGLMTITGLQTMPDDAILAQNPDLQGMYDAQQAASAAANRATQTLLSGGNISEDPAVKLAAARQELERINQQIDEMSNVKPVQIITDASVDVEAAERALAELQRLKTDNPDMGLNPLIATPAQIAEAQVQMDQQIAEAQQRVDAARTNLDTAGQTDQSDIQAQVDALVVQRTEIERAITDLERLAMTPAQRLAEDKKKLEEVLAEMEAVSQRIAQTQAKIRYAPPTTDTTYEQNQVAADRERLNQLGAERNLLMEQPALAAAMKAEQATQQTGSLDLYQRLVASATTSEMNGQQPQQIVGADGQNVAQIAQELAASAQALNEAQQGMYAAATGGSQEVQAEAQGALELAAARYQSAVAAGNLADATLKLNEARQTGNADAQREAEADMQSAQAQMKSAEAAEKSIFSKITVAEASAQVAQAEQQYRAALAGSVPAIVASAEANLRAAQSKLASAIASQGLVTNETSVVSIAGQMFDAVSGLPVAFDAAALGTEGLKLALDQVKLKMQEITMQAGSMAMSIGYNMIPYLGVAGGMALGKENAAKMQGLSDIIAPSVDSGQLSPDAAQQFMNIGTGILQQEANQMISGTGAAASSAEKSVKALNSALENLARSELSDSTKGLIDLDSMLGREDVVDEKARRMADVAVKGFESPWFEGLKDMFPADVLEKGADAVKGYAAQMVRDHQKGLTNVFYDTEMAADNVIDKINAKVNQDKLVAEVRDKVKEKLGGEGAAISDEDIMSALGIDTSEQAMSGAVSKMTMSFDEFSKQMKELLGGDEAGEAAVKLTEVPPDKMGEVKKNAEDLGGAVGGAFVDYLHNGAYGSKAIAKINEDIAAKKQAVVDAAGEVGKWWGDAFKNKVEANVPTALLDILVNKLLPLMQKAQADEGERTGELPPV